MRGLIFAASSALVVSVLVGVGGGCGSSDGDSEFVDPNAEGGLGDGGVGPFGDGAKPTNDGASSTDGGDCSAKVIGLIRDFKDTHPDFESVEGANQGPDPGIVQDLLGSDHKPVYKPTGGATTKSTTGKANF